MCGNLCLITGYSDHADTEDTRIVYSLEQKSTLLLQMPWWGNYWEKLPLKGATSPKLFQIPECNAVLKLHFQVLVSAETSWQKSISVKDLLLIFAELERTDSFHTASVSMFPCCQH